jgi:hypothetical protein
VSILKGSMSVETSSNDELDLLLKFCSIYLQMISKAFSSDEGNNDREEDITVLRRIWIVKRD